MSLFFQSPGPTRPEKFAKLMGLWVRILLWPSVGDVVPLSDFPE